MNIIGISSHYHDSAACLVSDGILVAAAQEERFSRKKHDRRVPLNALNYCIEEGGLSISDIDCVAYYENPAKKLERQVWTQLPSIRERGIAELGRFDPFRPLREIRELIGYTGRIACFDHHLSHAASSYYFSGFADAAVLTVDGVGEWATAAYGECRYLDQMRQLGQVTEGGDVQLDLQFFDFSGRGTMYTERFCSLFARAARDPETELDGFHR